MGGNHFRVQASHHKKLERTDADEVGNMRQKQCACGKWTRLDKEKKIVDLLYRKYHVCDPKHQP